MWPRWGLGFALIERIALPCTCQWHAKQGHARVTHRARPQFCFVLMPMRGALIGLYDEIKATLMDGLWDRVERAKGIQELQRSPYF